MNDCLQRLKLTLLIPHISKALRTLGGQDSMAAESSVEEGSPRDVLGSEWVPTPVRRLISTIGWARTPGLANRVPLTYRSSQQPTSRKLVKMSVIVRFAICYRFNV